jgi:HD-GYP domain-containing protein (c-di-GMP phosphodiesterase class II)
VQADAMMSDRPYRKALSLTETIREMERSLGKQFDPEAVDVIVSILEAGANSATRPALARASTVT